MFHLRHPPGTTAGALQSAWGTALSGRVPISSHNGVVTSVGFNNSPYYPPYYPPYSQIGGYCSSPKSDNAKSDKCTKYTSLAPPSDSDNYCNSNPRESQEKGSGLIMNHTPRGDGVLMTVEYVNGRKVTTCYPGAPLYKRSDSSGAYGSSSSSPSSSSSSCAGGACSRPQPVYTAPVYTAPVPVAPVPVAPVPVAPVHAMPVSTDIKPSKSKNSSQKNITIYVLGQKPGKPGNRDGEMVKDSLTGCNNFSGVDSWLFEQFNIRIIATDDHELVKQSIEAGNKIDILIGLNDRCNDLLKVCEQTGYDGSLLLIGGATEGVIRTDRNIPKTVKSSILTHGFGNGCVISEDDFKSIVGTTDSFIYVNERDGKIPSSLFNPRQVNRSNPHPYAMELIRALKFSHDPTKDWANIKLILVNKFGYDDDVTANPWA
jgi:hypothetical protein